MDAVILYTLHAKLGMAIRDQQHTTPADAIKRLDGIDVALASLAKQADSQDHKNRLSVSAGKVYGALQALAEQARQDVPQPEAVRKAWDDIGHAFVILDRVVRDTPAPGAKALPALTKTKAKPRGTPWLRRVANALGLAASVAVASANMQPAEKPPAPLPVAEAIVAQPPIAEEAAQAVPINYRGAFGRIVPYLPIITDAAKQTSLVRPEILIAMIMQESGGDPNAVSYRGAAGIAQFTYGTAQVFKQYFEKLTPCGKGPVPRCNAGNDDRFDPQRGILAQAAYMEDLLERFRGYEAQAALALASYNGGTLAVYSALQSITPEARQWHHLSWQDIEIAITKLPDTLQDNTGEVHEVYKDEMTNYVERIIAAVPHWRAILEQPIVQLASSQPADQAAGSP